MAATKRSLNWRRFHKSQVEKEQPDDRKRASEYDHPVGEVTRQAAAELLLFLRASPEERTRWTPETPSRIDILGLCGQKMVDDIRRGGATVTNATHYRHQRAGWNPYQSEDAALDSIGPLTGGKAFLR